MSFTRDLHILQGLKVEGLLSWLSQDSQHHPDWLLPELKVRLTPGTQITLAQDSVRYY